MSIFIWDLSHLNKANQFKSLTAKNDRKNTCAAIESGVCPACRVKLKSFASTHEGKTRRHEESTSKWRGRPWRSEVPAEDSQRLMSSALSLPG